MVCVIRNDITSQLVNCFVVNAIMYSKRLSIPLFLSTKGEWVGGWTVIIVCLKSIVTYKQSLLTITLLAS